MKRLLVVIAIALAVLAMALPARAQVAPPNDDFADATVISALPFLDFQDIAAATDEATDPDCGGSTHTIWYRFTAPAGMHLIGITGNLDDTRLGVYTGSLGNLTQVGCIGVPVSDPEPFEFDAVQGETYFFMAAADAATEFPEGFARTIGFSLTSALELSEFSINPVGTVRPSTGLVTVSGTLTCSQSATIRIEGTISQRAGRTIVTGTFFTTFTCNGTTSWSASTTGENGRFVGGKAHVVASVTGDFPLTTEQAVRLKGSP